MTTSFVFFDKWGHQEMVTGYLWEPFPNKFEGLGSNICSENPIKLFVFSRCFSPDWSGNTMDLRFPSDQPFQQACPVIPLGLWPSWSKPQETQKNHWCWWFGTWLLVSISYMGCHPSRWRTPSFFKMGTLHHQPVIDVESLLKTCLFFRCVTWCDPILEKSMNPAAGRFQVHRILEADWEGIWFVEVLYLGYQPLRLRYDLFDSDGIWNLSPGMLEISQI